MKYLGQISESLDNVNKKYVDYQGAKIPYGEVASTSTSTAYTATVPGINELVDGTIVMLKNGVVTSASGFTININGLGAKPVYNSMATGYGTTAPTRDTTIFNQAYTMLFVYSTDLVDGGCWICYRGYDGNTNTIGYQLRTNSGNLVASDTGYRYRLWLTSANGEKWVPINTSTSTDATTARTLNTRAIDPFGSIVYNSTNGTVSSGARPSVTTIWQQYTLTIGYSYVKTLTAWNPVFLKCSPNTDGSAVMEDIVQDLPTTNDGFIYIFLGIAYSTTAMELNIHHPVYYHDGTGIRIWTGKAIPTKTSQLTNDSNFITSDSLPTKTSDLTNDSGYVTTDTKNTAGSTNSTSKLYLIGATSQTANSQTYSNSGLYFNSGLYSNVESSSGAIYSTISQSTASITLSASRDQVGGGTLSVSTSSSTPKIALGLQGSSGSTTTDYISIVPSGVTITNLITPTNDTDAATKKYVDDSIPTVPTISLNGTSTTSAAFYAPTSAGTSGYYLKSNGSGAPSWSLISDNDENVKSTLVTTGGTYYIVGSSSSSTNTSTLNKHDSVSFFVTTNTSVGDARLILGNSTTSGTNSKKGLVRLYGSTAYYTDIISGTPSENRTITLPNATGTVALTSDIPTVPSNISAFTNDAGYTTNTGTVTSVRVQATSPVQSSTSTAQTGTLNTTISLANGYGDTKNPYGSKTANYVLAAPSLADGAPSFRYLDHDDITNALPLDTSEVIFAGSTFYLPAFSTSDDVTGYGYTGNVYGTDGTVGNVVESISTELDEFESEIFNLVVPTIPQINLNGSITTSPSFYAPTTAGTSGYYLKSNGSGAPTWAAIPSGGVSDVTLDGTSVVSSGIAALTSTVVSATDDGNGNVTLVVSGVSAASGGSF